VPQRKFLDSRRLRLYVVAYLRGLLNPYYDHGIQSILRERMVLRAISMELEGDLLREVATIKAMLADMAQNRLDAVGNVYSALKSFSNRIELVDENNMVLDKSIQGMINNYKKMKASGELEEKSKYHDEIMSRMDSTVLGFNFPKGAKLQWKMRGK
jgi:hypothetical protein